MQVIPAIDLYEGKCVRLREGDFSTRREYASDPKEVGERFAAAGAKLLHIVDLEGAREGRIVNWESLERILAIKDIGVQFGGGIRAEEDVRKLLRMGVNRVIAGSIAIRSPEMLQDWIAEFGTERFCVAVDVKDRNVATDAWQSKERIDLEATISDLKTLGVKTFLCTDISRDGTLSGPNIPLYEELVEKFPSREWLASGGITAKMDLRKLQQTGIAGAIIGKAFYEGVLRLEELAEFLC